MTLITMGRLKPASQERKFMLNDCWLYKAVDGAGIGAF
jgi:hypothetical protein